LSGIRFAKISMLAFAILSCTQPRLDDPASGRETSARGESPNTGGFDANENAANGETDPTENGISSERNSSEQSSSSDVPINEYSGFGTLDHRKGRANVQEHIIAKLEPKTLTISIVQLFSPNGSEAKNVSFSLKDKTGDTISTRLSQADIEQQEKIEGRSYPNFLVFARKMLRRNSKGDQKFDFSNPVPVMVVPAPASRYEALDQGPMSFTSNVTGFKSFTLNSTISKTTTAEGNIVITMAYVIPEDVKGELYEIFPLGNLGEYEINGTEKRIRKIHTLSKYYDSGKDETYDVDLRLDLCRVTNPDQAPEEFTNCSG
jgi:hypothetical protein